MEDLTAATNLGELGIVTVFAYVFIRLGNAARTIADAAKAGVAAVSKHWERQAENDKTGLELLGTIAEVLVARDSEKRNAA